MNLIGIFCVALGGAFGSICRYLMASLVTRYNPGRFPYGTLIINVLGGFLMGAFISWMAMHTPSRGCEIHLLVAVGVLGGFTTFSTFSLDSYYLLERGLVLQSAVYMALSVMLALFALIAGMWLVRTFSA